MPRPRTRCATPIPRQVAASDRSQWKQLLAEQHGAVDTEQLAAFGITPDAIAAHVGAGRWRPLLPRVYGTTTGEPTRATWLHAALHYAGPSVVLSHRTAAEEWGMLRVEPGPVHVTVPYRCSAVSQPPHVVVHRSRAFAYIAVATVPPRTSRADTVLDLATAEPTARDATRRLVGLATTCGIPLPELERQMSERPPYRYQRALAAALRRMAGGVASVLEDRYALDVGRARYPPGATADAVRGGRVHLVGGRRI